jgi:hypothetical protein
LAEILTQLPLISVRVSYKDLPDLIEVETRVAAAGWQGMARAYTGPGSLLDAARRLRLWAARPVGEFALEAGADTGIGWLFVRWESSGGRGAIPCHVHIATNAGDPKISWRLSLAWPVESWSLERFARQLERVAETLQGEANLEGVPD